MENLQATTLQRSILGTENADGRQHFVMDGGKTGEELLKQRAISKFNDAVDAEVKRMEDYNNKIREAAEKVIENAENLEILPIRKNLIVQPFAENPFQRLKTTDSGIIYDTGGLAPTYKRNEDGQVVEQEQFIVVATVIGAGPECTYIQEGDTIMYTRPSQTPLPFFKQGFFVVPEERVMAVVNEGLTERFKNINK